MRTLILRRTAILSDSQHTPSIACHVHAWDLWTGMKYRSMCNIPRIPFRARNVVFTRRRPKGGTTGSDTMLGNWDTRIQQYDGEGVRTTFLPISTRALYQLSYPRLIPCVLSGNNEYNTVSRVPVPIGTIRMPCAASSIDSMII